MLIQSRKESRTCARLYRYKDHEVTRTHIDRISAPRATTAYIPALNDPADAVPVYYINFGMDHRRFVMALDREELTTLRDDIDRLLKRPVVRRVK